MLCHYNDWDDGTKAKKLPTLLEGKALVIWLELTTEKKGSRTTSKALFEIVIGETTKGCPRGVGASQELSHIKSADVVTTAFQPSAAMCCMDTKEVARYD